MNKHLIVIGITLILLTVGFSGCTNVDNQDTTQLSIKSFNVEPSMINKGETANLIWDVEGATTVSIDNDIGNVSLSGTRIITPTQNTTYILTASNSTSFKTATTQIIVLMETESDDDEDYNDDVNPIAVFDIENFGTFKVELFVDKTPITVGNFRKLVNDVFL